MPAKPDRVALYSTATAQHGYFTTPQAATWGTAPEQIVAAVIDALDRRMAGVEDLRAASSGRGRRVADLIELGMAEFGAS